MQPDIRPSYGPVAFRDRSTGQLVVTRSTRASRPRSRRSGWALRGPRSWGVLEGGREPWLGDIRDVA